jgi:CSLREA domain-containing protein
MKTLYWGLFALFVLGIVALAARVPLARATQADAAQAGATITVNTLIDTDTEDAYCSLREAIIAANTNTAYHGCTAGSGDDFITFSVTGIIALSDSLPAITSDLSINGPVTSDLVVSGSGKYMIFDVTSPATTTLQNLTVQQGYGPWYSHGAGVYANGGTLNIKATTFITNTYDDSRGGAAVYGEGSIIHVSGSSFIGNVAGGRGAFHVHGGALTVISGTFTGNSPRGALLVDGAAQATISYSTFAHNEHNAGSAIDIAEGSQVTVMHSTFYSNTGSYPDAGSAIRNNASMLTVIDTTFSGNQGTALASLGAGSTLIVSNSTFSDNNGSLSALACGSGSCAPGCEPGVCTVANSTFMGNSGGQAIGGGAGAFTMTNCTIAGNAAGGLYRFTGMLRNTIIANNSGSGNCSESTVTNGGNNLDSGTTCSFGAANGSLSNTDPLLGSLADNGGPTLTMAPSFQSPAIDGVTYNAPNGCPAADQRGVARPIDGNGDGNALCDIGAYEVPTQYAIYLPIVIR